MGWDGGLRTEIIQIGREIEEVKKILFQIKKRTNLSVFYYFEFAYTLLYAV